MNFPKVCFWTNSIKNVHSRTQIFTISKTCIFWVRTTENSKIGLSRIQKRRREQKTEANSGCARFGGYDTLWKYYIWNFRTTVWGFRFFEILTTFRAFGKFNRIPGTLRNCTFAIHFENGGRGCVRLAEAFCSQVPEKIVTVPKNQILFRKQILCRFSVISILTIITILYRGPSLLSATRGIWYYSKSLYFPINMEGAG